MKDVTAITKALSDASRVRILLFLRGGEMCVCQIIEMLSLAPSTVSKHLNILHQSGLLESAKQGRWVYYRLAGRGAAPAVRGAIRWLVESLADDPRIIADAAKARAVGRMSLDKLCCRYKA